MSRPCQLTTSGPVPLWSFSGNPASSARLFRSCGPCWQVFRRVATVTARPGPRATACGAGVGAASGARGTVPGMARGPRSPGPGPPGRPLATCAGRWGTGGHFATEIGTSTVVHRWKIRSPRTASLAIQGPPRRWGSVGWVGVGGTQCKGRATLNVASGRASMSRWEHDTAGMGPVQRSRLSFRNLLGGPRDRWGRARNGTCARHRQ